MGGEVGMWRLQCSQQSHALLRYQCGGAGTPVVCPSLPLFLGVEVDMRRWRWWGVRAVAAVATGVLVGRWGGADKLGWFWGCPTADVCGAFDAAHRVLVCVYRMSCLFDVGTVGSAREGGVQLAVAAGLRTHVFGAQVVHLLQLRRFGLVTSELCMHCCFCRWC
jgi:hypothetical protein